MTDQQRVCPKCRHGMDEGFFIDRTYGGAVPTEWVEGPPKRSIWTGLKTSKDKQHEVKTYRCTSCGYLESYAS